MSAYHPLLTIDGYKSLTGYNNLPILSENDILVTIDRLSKIKIINRNIENPEVMYNLEVVNDNHNFFANGIVVHNADNDDCSDLP